MSEQILLLNPRPKKRRRKTRRAHRVRHNRRQPRRRRRARVRHNRRFYVRAKRRRNRRHYARRYRVRHNRRYARRYRVRHNRRSRRFSVPGVGSLKSIIVPAVVGAFGALGIDYAWGYVSQQSVVPAQLKSGWGGIAAKAALALGVGALGYKFARGQRKFVAWAVGGALTYQAIGVIRSLMSGQSMSGYIDYQAYNLPGSRMSGYMRAVPQLGDLGDWFSPAAVIQPQGTPVPQQFGGYMPRAAPLGGYIAAQPHVMGGYDWQNDGM